MNVRRSIAIFASGCFWCTEAIFKELKGVTAVESGYTGGHVIHPTYEQVCSGTTGHAEAVRIEFDPRVVPYERLVEVFFTMHDPTQLNRQGHDIGTQYRSAVFVVDDEQRRTVMAVRDRLIAAGVFSGPVVTAIESLTEFYPAEEYHQNYFARNPEQAYCQAVIDPKLAAFRKKFADWRTS